MLQLIRALDNTRPKAPAARVDFPEGTRLLAQDMPAKHIYLLAQGVVRLTRFLPDGQRQVLGFGLPGNLVGFQTGDHYSFSVEAITSTKADQFLRTNLMELANRKPDFAFNVFELLAQELSIVQDQISIFGYRSAEKRVAFFLINLRDRWARIIGSDKPFPMPMTRQDIADFLGLRLETVSRTMSRMAREKLIETKGGQVRILDNSRMLEVLAGGWPSGLAKRKQ